MLAADDRVFAAVHLAQPLDATPIAGRDPDLPLELEVSVWATYDKTKELIGVDWASVLRAPLEHRDTFTIALFPGEFPEPETAGVDVFVGRRSDALHRFFATNAAARRGPTRLEVEAELRFKPTSGLPVTIARGDVLIDVAHWADALRRRRAVAEREESAARALFRLPPSQLASVEPALMHWLHVRYADSDYQPIRVATQTGWWARTWSGSAVAHVSRGSSTVQITPQPSEVALETMVVFARSDGSCVARAMTFLATRPLDVGEVPSPERLSIERNPSLDRELDCANAQPVPRQ